MSVYVGVLVVYLGILAMIGLIMGRRGRSAEGFAIGGRSVGPWVTALSFVAAYYSSVVIIGGGAFGWRFGLSTLWVGAGNVLIGTTLAWIVLGRRIRRFTENLDAMTLPGFFFGRYGSPQPASSRRASRRCSWSSTTCRCSRAWPTPSRC